jgi:hypothetical protein
MSFGLNAIFSLTIGLSVLIGWTRFHKTDPAFLPFLILVSLAFVNELTGILLALNGYHNIISINIFQLAEAGLLTWQFRKWGLFRRHKNLYYGIQAFFAATWIAESLALPREYDSYFIILHSFVIVLMGIFCLNHVVMNESTPLYRHPVSLICMGLIGFFSYAILVEAFWTVHLYEQRFFRLKVFEVMSYINLVTNIIFAFAFLCIPMKPQYIMR